jgi:dihydroneopterin aldolase
MVETDRAGASDGLMDRITLRSIRIEGRLGATAEERDAPQLVEIDLEVEADLAAASESDMLADTVDYGPLVALVTSTVAGGAYHLLEGLAGAIARRALAADGRIRGVTVRVRKLAVPLDVDIDHAEVQLHRVRTTE